MKLSAAFGQEVKRARQKLGISQEELAHRAGLHRTYVSLVERGLRSSTIDAALRLSSGLGTPLSALIKRAERRLTH